MLPRSPRNQCRSRSRTRRQTQSVTSCLACFEVASGGPNEVSCSHGHAICGDCTPQFINVTLERGTAAFPVICPLPRCGAVVKESSFRAACSIEQCARLDDITVDIVGAAAVKPGEQLFRCRYCPYMDVRENISSDGGSLHVCRHQFCGVTSCFVCGFDVCFKDSLVDDVFDVELGLHATCADVADLFLRVQQAVGPRRCPSCKLAVVKDDQCTQMLCVCGHKWCYICDASLGDDADLHDASPHRQSSPNCPLMLEEYHEWDPSWPEDGSDALVLLHQNRAISELHLLFSEDPVKFQTLIECVPSILASYDLEEIRSGAPDLPTAPAGWWESLSEDDHEDLPVSSLVRIINGHLNIDDDDFARFKLELNFLIWRSGNTLLERPRHYWGWQAIISIKWESIHVDFPILSFLTQDSNLEYIESETMRGTKLRLKTIGTARLGTVAVHISCDDHLGGTQALRLCIDLFESTREDYVNWSRTYHLAVDVQALTPSVQIYGYFNSEVPCYRREEMDPAGDHLECTSGRFGSCLGCSSDRSVKLFGDGEIYCETCWFVLCFAKPWSHGEWVSPFV